MFGYVPGFVSTSRFSSPSFSGLPGACALAIKFGCVPDFVFTFACTGSSASPGCLFAALALPHAFVLVECLDRIGVRFALIHRRLEIAILGCCLLT